MAKPGQQPLGRTDADALCLLMRKRSAPVGLLGRTSWGARTRLKPDAEVEQPTPLLPVEKSKCGPSHFSALGRQRGIARCACRRRHPPHQGEPKPPPLRDPGSCVKVHVAIIDRSSRVAETAMELADQSGSLVRPYECDATDPVPLQHLATQIAAECGPCDHLVYAAGVGGVADLPLPRRRTAAITRMMAPSTIQTTGGIPPAELPVGSDCNSKINEFISKTPIPTLE